MSKKLNTLIYGMHWKSQVKAMRKLEKVGLIDIKVWIGKNDNSFDVHIGKLRRVRIEKEKYSGLNSDIYDEVRKEALEGFLEMFSRNPAQYAITHQEALHMYNYFFDYFSNMLHKNRIELMVFYMFPHFGSDYLLTVIAKQMGIKMILLSQELPPNRFTFVTDLDDYGLFNGVKIRNEYPFQKVDFTHKKVQFYMKNIKLKYRSCNYTLLLKLKKYIFRSIGRMTFLCLIKSYMDCITFKMNYKKLAVDSVDFSKKYVYFPLQMQPELTTSTLGGIYSDHILAIEKISNLIPDDWKIYVKENPKQLESHRGKFFFKRLKLIEKAVYVSQTVSSFDLIENSQFVATITSTTGWEAILANKVCVMFGNNWYKKFNGIIPYRNNLKLDEVLNYQIDKEQIEKDYNEFLSKTFEGIIDRGYIANYKDYTDEGNTENVYKSLYRILTENIV